MATPPTLVGGVDHESAWNTATTPKNGGAWTPSNSANLIVGVAAKEATTGTLAVTGGTGLTWTSRQAINTASNCAMQGSTASTTAVSTTPTATLSSGTNHFGVDFLEFSGTGGYDSSASGTGKTGTHPTQAITTLSDNCALVVIVTDFNAITHAGITWDTVNGASPTVYADYVTVGSDYGVLVAVYADAGTAGVKTPGVTFGAGVQAGIIVIAVKGSAGSTSNADLAQSVVATQAATAVLTALANAAQTVTATQTGSALLVALAAAAQAVVATQTASAVLTRKLDAAQTVTATQSATATGTLGSAAAQSVIATQAATIVLTRLADIAQAVTATQSASATGTLLANTAQSVVATQVATITLTRLADLAQTVVATQAASAIGTLLANAAQSVVVTQTASATVTHPGTNADLAQSVVATQVATAVLTRLLDAAQTVTVTQAATITLTRVLDAAQSVIATQAATAVGTLLANAAQSIVVTQSASATVSSGKSADLAQSVVATQVATALLIARANAAQAVVATQAATVTLRRLLDAAQNVIASQVATAVLTRTISAAQSITATQSASATVTQAGSVLWPVTAGGSSTPVGPMTSAASPTRPVTFSASSTTYPVTDGGSTGIDGGPVTIPDDGIITHGSELTLADVGYTAYFADDLGRTLVESDLTDYRGSGTHDAGDFITGATPGSGTQADPYIIERIAVDRIRMDRPWITFRGVLAGSIFNDLNGTHHEGMGLDYVTFDPDAPDGQQNTQWEDYWANRCLFQGNTDGARANGGTIIGTTFTECIFYVTAQDAGDHNDNIQLSGGAGTVDIDRCQFHMGTTNFPTLGSSICQFADMTSGTTFRAEIRDSMFFGKLGSVDTNECLRLYDGGLTANITYLATGNLFDQNSTSPPVGRGSSNTTPTGQITWSNNAYLDGTPIALV